jgi:hypothetical protein
VKCLRRTSSGLAGLIVRTPRPYYLVSIASCNSSVGDAEP